MDRYRFSLVISLCAILPLASASAHLWESQVEIEKRYGQPIKTTGYPDRRAFIYAFDSLEIRVKYFNGVSEAESYLPSAERVAFGDPEVQRLLKLNSDGGQWREQTKDDWVIDARKERAYADFLRDATKPRLDVYTHGHVERNNSSSHVRTLKEETYEGVATLRQEGETTSVTMHSGGRVVYLPWSEGWRDRGLKGLFRSGKTYRITLRDEWVLDDDEPWAFVSDREHKDYHDTVNDSQCYVLMRIEEGEAVIFDRSVCELHHVKMSEIKAKVRDGNSPPPPGEAECERKLPHYRDFLKIICIADGTEEASLYVCPECVAACKRLTEPNR